MGINKFYDSNLRLESGQEFIQIFGVDIATKGFFEVFDCIFCFNFIKTISNLKIKKILSTQNGKNK